MISNTMDDELYLYLMRHFDPAVNDEPRGLTPREQLTRALLTSDEPISVPVAWALEHCFSDIYIGEYCKAMHIHYEIITYPGIPRQYYEFSFLTEDDESNADYAKCLTPSPDDSL